ncbi:MAG TPA: glutamine-hydrolyzing carbamoyl-phosphate synthase small subunit [Epulopiscium sp.]|nr:glutamine-hydrolyzing carbamoyl-phosphate synthase small subunit [Candidatus Epulonipiscium sp.]
MKAQLILENGMVFEGQAFGYFKEKIGEVIVNTSMTGYQEILTNPAYYGQIVIMTYPMIGNYGINLDDMQSKKVQIKGLVVREKCDIPNNFRCELTLDGYMKASGIIGIEGIDTRALAKVVRECGVMKGIIAVRELTPSQIKLKLEAFSNSEAVGKVTRAEISYIEGTGKHIGIVDLGVRQSAIHSLKAKGCKITLFPAFTSAKEFLESNFDGILVSSGPGSPHDIPQVTEEIKNLVGKIPLIGMGLGHQVLALAIGAEVSRLGFGHHGGAQSVKDTLTNRIQSTSQTHSYVVSRLPSEAVISHININDETIEGMYVKEKRIYSIQFHPQSPTVSGEIDSIYDNFLTIIQGGQL